MESSSVGSVTANPNRGKFPFTLNHYTQSIWRGWRSQIAENVRIFPQEILAHFLQKLCDACAIATHGFRDRFLRTARHP